MYKVFHDVVYVKKENDYMSLKYNNRFITQIPNEEFESYIKSDIENWNDGHVGFQKSQIWYYEKETRFLIKLKDGVLDRVKEHEKKYNYKANKNDVFIISLDFENIYNTLIKRGRMKIMFAPSIVDDKTMLAYNSEEDLIGMDEALKNYQAIKDFITETSYLDCWIEGLVDENQVKEVEKIPCGTFKTLREDLKAMRIMGELAGILTFYARKYINQNFEKYCPKEN